MLRHTATLLVLFAVMLGAPALAEEPAKPRQLGSSRFRHPGPVFHAAFSPDGKKLATASIGCVSVWETATGKLLLRVEKANARFHRVAYTPDGKTLYALIGPTREGAELLTLDAATGKEIAKAAITKVYYRGAEFTRDASRLAVFSFLEGGVVLIDPKTGKELARVRAFPEGNAFTPDGKTIALAGGEEKVRLIDSTTGKEVGMIKPETRNRTHWVRFVTPTEAIFAGHGVFERRDLKRNAVVWGPKGTLPGSEGSVLEVSPDGKRIARVMGSISGYLALHDAETGKELLDRKEANWDCAYVQFSPDSKIVATPTYSGTVILRDAATGKPLPQSADPPGSPGRLVFSADGRTLSASFGDKWVRWNLTAAEPRAEALAAFAALSPDGRVGVRPDSYKNRDDVAEFVDSVTGKRVAAFDPRETGNTVVVSSYSSPAASFSGDGKRFVAVRRWPTGSGGAQLDRSLGVWDTATGKRIAERDASKNPEDRAYPVAVSLNGKVVAIVRVEKDKHRIELWEPDTDKILWKREREVGRSELFVSFTDGGRKLAVQEFYPKQLQLGPFGGSFAPVGHMSLVILDAANGKVLTTLRGPALGEQPLVSGGYGGAYHVPPHGRAVSPDGKLFAVSDWDGTIYLWDVANNREKAKLTHPGPVNVLAFSPDGKLLAAASSAAPVTVYDLTAPKPKQP